MTPLLGRRVAWLNRRVTNRITRPLAGWLPGFGVVEHAGRRSGRPYRTPVNVFRAGASYGIALTYGVESDWVQNVLAAGGCDLVTRGHRHRLTAPAIVHDESRGWFRRRFGRRCGSCASATSFASSRPARPSVSSGPDLGERAVRSLTARPLFVPRCEPLSAR